MGRRGRLKIAWLRPCRFESCPGHQLPSLSKYEGIPSRVEKLKNLIGFGAEVRLLSHPSSNVVVGEKFFEDVAFEQGDALIAEFRQFDLDPIDLPGLREDLAHAKGIRTLTAQNLIAQ